MRLLVSVRSAREALEARRGGADIIDCKDPRRGPLGRLSRRATEGAAAALRAEGGVRVPISAALGELRERQSPDRFAALDGVDHYKLGLSGMESGPWREGLSAWCERLRGFGLGAGALVAAAYADWDSCGAPRPEEVIALGARLGVSYFLVDTFSKRGGTLLDWVSLERLAAWTAEAHAAGLRVALAGSLGAKEVERLAGLPFDVLAVRRAATREGRRGSAVDAAAVRRLVAALGYSSNSGSAARDAVEAALGTG